MMLPSEEKTLDAHVCNGVTTEFSTSFKVVDEADVEVLLFDLGTESEAPVSPYYTEQVLGSDYTVSDVGNDTGATVTMSTPPATRYILVIASKVATSQSVDYDPSGGFPYNEHEAQMDRLTRLCQEALTAGGLALRLSRADGHVSGGHELPPATVRAEKALTFDADGQLELVERMTTATLQGYEQAASDFADAASTSSAAALDFRNEAEGFRDEAEGFRDGAETARDVAIAVSGKVFTRDGDSNAGFLSEKLLGSSSIDATIEDAAAGGGGTMPILRLSAILDPTGPLIIGPSGITMPEVPDGGIVVTSSGLKATGIVKATPNDEATADLNAKIAPAWPLYDFPNGTVIDDQAQLPLNLKLALLGGLEAVGSNSETATDGLRVVVDGTTIERGASGLGVKGLNYDTTIEGLRWVRGVLKIEHDGSGGFTSSWGVAMRTAFPLGLDEVILGANVTPTTVPTLSFVGGNGVCYNSGNGYFHLDTENLSSGTYPEKLALIPGNIELNTTGTTLTHWNMWNSTDSIDGVSNNRPVVRLYNGTARIVPSTLGAGLLWLPFWAILPKHPLA